METAIVTHAIDRRRRKDVDVIVVPGELGDDGLLELRRELIASTGPDVDRLEIDLRSAGHVDATVLGMLSDAARLRSRWGGTIAVRCASPELIRLLRITLLDRLIDVVPTREAAAAARRAA
jgi:anti-anti-sigma factor